MRPDAKRFLRENLLGLSLTLIGVLCLILSVILYLDSRSSRFALAEGGELGGAEIEALIRQNRAFERIAEAVQLLALAQRAAAADDVVEGLEIGVAHPQRQAQLTQAAIFTGYLDTGDTNDLGIFIFLHAAFSLSPENLGPPRHFNRNRKVASIDST